ncbi:MAG: hypothetical protein AAF628_31255 [Planctomycetota bacterium]
MFHVTLFAGTEGEIAPSGFTALTVFGGAELRRPTLATQLLHLKGRRHKPLSRWQRWFGTEQNLVITLFGGTVLFAPTMAEEYAALSSALRGGAIAADEAATLVDQLAAFGHERAVCRTLTLFGACVVRHPSAGKERKALEAAVQVGAIEDKVRGGLEAFIGAPPEARLHALARLAGAAPA